jgi:hypothetical protein
MPNARFQGKFGITRFCQMANVANWLIGFAIAVDMMLNGYAIASFPTAIHYLPGRSELRTVRVGVQGQEWISRERVELNNGTTHGGWFQTGHVSSFRGLEQTHFDER